MTTETLLIANDLRNAGFRVAYTGSNWIAVSLSNRRTSEWEVGNALLDLGFEEGMFEIHTGQLGSILVRAEVG